MNWDAITAIAETVGVIVVVVSLLYLAIQIKFAKLAAADVSRHLRSNGVREIGLAMATNADLRKNWLESSDLDKEFGQLAERLGVSVDAAAQLDWMVTSWIWLHWGQFSSTTTQADVDELEHLIGVFYSAPPISVIWNHSPYQKGLTEAKFVEFVETAVSKYGRSGSTHDAT